MRILLVFKSTEQAQSESPTSRSSLRARLSLKRTTGPPQSTLSDGPASEYATPRARLRVRRRHGPASEHVIHHREFALVQPLLLLQIAAQPSHLQRCPRVHTPTSVPDFRVAYYHEREPTGIADF
eukprot:3350539-Rhodomonas_salina.2